MKKAIITTFAIIAFVLAAAEENFACSCLQSNASQKTLVSRAFKSSVRVFSGTVTSIREIDEVTLEVKLKVKDVWKGGRVAEIVVTTTKDSGLCGYGFDVGGEYLVYAHGTAENPGVSLCSRTAGLAENSDIKYLAKLKRK